MPGSSSTHRPMAMRRMAAPGGSTTDLGPLLAGCAAVLEPGGFVLLTAHTPSLDADDLRTSLVRDMRLPHAAVEVGDLDLETADGRTLGLGWFARAAGQA